MTAPEKTPPTIEFHYLKTPGYRIHHVDGAYGGITPQRNIFLELYCEHNATPLRVEHEISEKGVLGDERNRDGKSGIVRQIECGAVMDVSTARALRNWLDQKIEEVAAIDPAEGGHPDAS